MRVSYSAGERVPAGVYPMLFALFGEDGRLDRNAMRKQVEALIRAGVHGIAVLGLASESNKLSAEERRDFIRWASEDIAGYVPLSATISGANAAEQVSLAKFALDHGAAWLVLQPPPVTGVSPAALGRFFGGVAHQIPAPIGIQIAPEYLGNAISVADALELNRQHSNLSILKVELPGYAVTEMCAAAGGRFSVLNGQDGVDMPDSIRGGAAGCIPGGEAADELAAIYDDIKEASPEANERADRRYKELMPLIAFLMRSIDIFLTYGKPILCRRLALPDYNGLPRSPSSAITDARLRVAEYWSRHLGRF
jgi:2-keto-3-deoxy-L-arabinonate dehydratase